MYYGNQSEDTWPSPGSQNQGSDRDSSETERDFRSSSRSDRSSTQRRDSALQNGFAGLDPRNGSVGTLPDTVPIIPYWSAKRHITCGNPTPPPPWAPQMTPWRASPAKVKTSNAALVLCLNIDVDPPDIVKTNPCAVLECWVDPHTMPSYKALEVIGTNLQHQFEGLSPKIPYKPILDPSSDDLRLNCEKARKVAGDDTVLFYYNGHGVPKPTPSGELWCFNKNYTQYIPVTLNDVLGWLKTPCVYIWDCSAAGNLLTNLTTFAKAKDEQALHTGGVSEHPYIEAIQLAACLADEQLPSCPELPGDLFTACLTSPIDIALRYFIANNQLPNNLTADNVMQIPGDLKDRRTPLGELNWIFTAITDTIAWTTFPRDVFTRLYRSDLLVASLFRNFLLAERIMKDFHCTPHTYPQLPPTKTHPLWASWDLAIDSCLRQLPDLLRTNPPQGAPPASVTAASRRRAQKPEQNPPNPDEKPYIYVPSRFFADQLTAFEVWISRGGSALTKRGPLSLPPNGDGPSEPSKEDADGSPIVGTENGDRHLVPRKPPDQLPIVLQVLLSQPHRLRALILLSQFVDLGPWAVHLALTIGIFPYISRLLQATGQDLRPVLIFIWARIMAVDSSCQVDLYNNQGYKYFANILVSDDPRQAAIPNSSEHKAMCAFILSAIARDYPLGQNACWRERVFDACFERLEDGDFLLRQWSALCIAQIWDGNDDIRVYGVDRGTQDRLILLLTDASAEVRAAALYALGTFLGASGSSDSNRRGEGGSGTMEQLDERTHFRMEVAVVTGAALAIKEDASPMVRKELLVVISCLVKEWRGYFISCAWVYWEEERRRREGGHKSDEDIAVQAVSEWLDIFDDDQFREENRVLLSSFFTIYTVLLDLSVDPYQEVATNAQTVVDYITALLLDSPFTKIESTSLDTPPPAYQEAVKSMVLTNGRPRAPSLRSLQVTLQPPSPNLSRPGVHRSDTMSSTLTSGVTNTLRRTSSFASALKNLAGGIAFPSLEDGRASPRPSASNSRNDNREASRPPSPNFNYAQYTSPYARPSTPTNHPPTPTSPQPPSRPSSRGPLDFQPSDVMEALMEEDMERLRKRRRGEKSKRHAQGHGRGHAHAHAHNQAAAGPSHSHGHSHAIAEGLSSPSGSTFSMDSVQSVGLGTGKNIRDVLPLKSRFYDWCCEYFKEPQMRQPEADEPGSVQYNYQVWRQQRNEQVIRITRDQAELSGENCTWDRSVTTIQAPFFPTHMAFHAYDPHLVVTNDADTVSVYDWGQRRRLTTFCNGNPRGTGITSLHLINQDVGGIILTSSGDGIIRLYRNYDPAVTNEPVQMVSSFRGLNDVIRTRMGAGIVTTWKQSGGLLFVSGDSKIIRVWDAHTESQIMDLDTDSESPVTSMISEEMRSFVLAGFGDGTMRLFDRRLEEENAVIRKFQDHKTWIQNVRWHPHKAYQFLSASVDGELKLWDLRQEQAPIISHHLFSPQGLSAFDIHEQTAVFAATSSVSHVSWRTQRSIVQPISVLSTPHVLQPTLSPMSMPPTRDSMSLFVHRTSSLTFHPRELVYATGLLDGTIRVMGAKLPRRRPDVI